MIKKIIKKLTPKFILPCYHYCLALFGALFFGFPSRKLIVIGVTGTSGKSTTTNFIAKILEEACHKVAMISTIKFKIGNNEWENNLKMTMPGRFTIQKFLWQAKKEGCKYVVLEVSSEGVKQFRHKFINFKTAVFTNLSPEHIEAHGGFENYRNAKLKFFKAVKNKHIINLDDENVEYFIKTKAREKIGFCIASSSLRGAKRRSNPELKPRILDCHARPAGSLAMTITAKNVVSDEKAVSFDLLTTHYSLQTLGEFNVYNALAAICVAQTEGISLEICQKALEKISGIPGRMEIVVNVPFKVIVDYAHTPEQLENVYKTLEGNLICVLGSCGGGRDKWKRPVLGEIASRYCDQIILTNEDPYDENPNQILSEIKFGISNPPPPPFGLRRAGKIQMSNFYEILDRKEAIKKALLLAKPNDIVIITGKGSETLMCLENNKKIPWSDKEIVLEELRKNKG